MADNERTNSGATEPKEEKKTEVQAETKQKAEKQESVDTRTPTEKKRDRAMEIGRDIKNKRERREKLEQAIIKAKDAKERAPLLGELVQLGSDIAKLMGQARGTLSPELERNIEAHEKELAERNRKGEEINFEEERRKAQRLETEGRTQKEPIKEVAGMVLDLEIQDLERAKAPRETIEVEKSASTGAGNWQELQDKKSNLQIDPNDPEDVARGKAEYAQILAQEEQLIKEALKSDPQLQKDKAELDQLRQQAKDSDNNAEVLARLEKMSYEAGKQAKDDLTLHQPDAGLRLAYINREKEKIFSESVSHSPAYREYSDAVREIDQARRNLRTRYDNEELGEEEFASRGHELTEQKNQMEQRLARQLAGERGRYYDPLPDKLAGQTQAQYEASLDAWVWQKISAIDTASISPSALVYSPAYTSLLYALTEANLPKRLKDNINAWRSVYEIALVWDASGQPVDVLQRAADMDPDAFLGLIGQFTKDGNRRVYSRHAENIQKAFAILEQKGFELAHGSDAESRGKIHSDIAAELDRELPEGEKFGNVYERIAYRYWKLLGREGKFDQPMARATKGDEDIRVRDEKLRVYREVSPDKRVLVDLRKGDAIKGNDLLPISQTANEIVSRRTKNRRYDFGYSKTSIKFWYRRLLPGGLYQEKNIKFNPRFFEGIKYDTTDYLTGSVKVKTEKGEDGFGRITKEALAAADWENKTGTYSVWVDDLRKTADTRKGALKADGILNSSLPPGPRQRAEMRAEWFETDPDKANGSMVEVLTAEIDSNRRRNLFDGVPILGALPIPKFSVEQERDENGKPIGPSHLRMSWSENQTATGVSAEPLGRGGIEDLIDEWTADGSVGAYEAEKLKRKYLAWLGIPGVGPVRFTARVTEAVLNPGNIFVVFWAGFGAFLGTFFGSILPLPGGGGGGKRR